MNGKSIKYHVTIGALKALALLPLSVLYVLSDFMFFVIYHVIHYRRAKTRENLSNSFPELSSAEIKRLERKFYHHLCDLFIETIKLLHISDEEMQRRVEFKNCRLVEQASEDGRPAFLFIGHMGNWEWVQEITKRTRHPKVNGELYRPLHSPLFDDVMKTIRTTRYKTHLVAVKQAVRTILTMRRTDHTFLMGFIGDQRPTRHSLHHWMTFLGQDTPYMVGGEEIGRHVNAKFLMLYITKPKRGHYVMEVRDMVLPAEKEAEGKDSYPYIELYMQMLEENIREQPEIYLWTHNRWKYRRVYASDGSWHAERK